MAESPTTCPGCGQESQPGWKFCAGCGADLRPVYPSCGTQNEAGVNFCVECGTDLAESPVQKKRPPRTDLAAPPPTEPASFGDGRYEVRKFLGEGGKKKVYLAQDTLLDREVAFALINTEGLDEASRTRIAREAQAMGRLGSHPHIVTVFDLGQHEGQPYMVTELMGGGDVEGLIENSPDHRIPLDQAIDIAGSVCRGLEFAHSKEIVHRDLKPGNVWLTDEGTAKIGDFGLAVSLDHSRLTQEGMMVGTVSYMPPEQALGGEVTARADLYSLGCMLYEMVTGRPPFLGDEAVAIIGQHINTPPVAPTWHNPGCPRPLEALILRLTAKDPAERPESVADVLSALESIDLAATTEASVAQEVHSLDSLAGGVFVGWQKEMGELKAALEDALSGRGRLVTLVGEPGIGKTRIASELATYAGLRKAQVLWGRCYEGGGAPPYWPWVQAIRSYVRERDAEKLKSEMGSGAVDIAEIVSDVKETLPDLKPPPALEPEQARFRLFDSIAAFLKSAGRGQPLVLILDDLHWADKASLLLLEFVARELSGSRLLVIGTYRDVEVSRQHPLSKTLAELTRGDLYQRVLLRGLSQEDVGRFIEIVAGISPPRSLVESVHGQTEGNPLFVTEVVRLLVQEGELTKERAGDSGSWSVRIPEGVREVIGRRLDRLSERCNQTLTIASVVGRQFGMEVLDRLIEDLSGDRLLEVVEEALSARVIEELPQTVGRYQFTHALIGETLAGELSTTRRVQLHARIGEALEEVYGAGVEAHAAELAHHFAEAVTVTGPEKLVKYSLLAGERALATHAHEEALTHFVRALAAKKDQPVDAETAAILFGLGRAQVATLERYRLEEAVATLGRAFDYYAEVGDAPRAVAVAEHTFPPRPGFSGFPTVVVQVIERALKLVPADSQEAGRLFSRYGGVLGLQEGDYEGAQKAFGRALAIAKREGDAALEMRTLASALYVDFFHRRYQESVEKSLMAINLAHRADDLQAELEAHFWACLALIHTGDLQGAEEHAAAALEPAEKLRNRFWLAGAIYLNQCVHRFKGDWRAARDFSDRGLAVSPMAFHLLSGRALLEYETGDFSQGEAHLERLVGVMRMSPPGSLAENTFTALVIPMCARIAGVDDRFDVAKTAAEAVLSSRFVPPHHAALTRAGLVLMAAQRVEGAAAEEQYAALESTRGTMMVGPGISSDRVLGLLAQTMDKLDEATAHFEDSLAFCGRAGYRPEYAWSTSDYADALFERNGPDDRTKAMSLLDEALAISRELGMRPLMERVLAHKGILKA